MSTPRVQSVPGWARSRAPRGSAEQPPAERMKVLLACLDFPPTLGGIQTMLSSLAAELNSWELTVVAPAAPGAAEFDRGQPYRVIRAQCPGGRNQTCRRVLGVALRVARLVRAERPDVLLWGHPLLGPLGPILRCAMGIPYLVFTYDVEVRNRYLRPFLPTIFRQAARVVTISRFSARQALAAGCSEDRVAQLPLGFDPRRFEGIAPSRLPRESTLVGRPWLLTVCRLDAHYKGVDTVLRALPIIAARVPEVRYVIAGDGRVRRELEQLADRLGCGERVDFVGRVSDAELATLYAHCTAFVLVSRDRESEGGAEGFGLVFLEANSFGRPVIGGNSGGIPEAVVDGITGLLAEPESVSSVADHVIRLLTDGELAATLGRQGRERVLQELTWSASARRLEQIVESALRKVPHAQASDRIY
jgi:phosphatidyl-myo-inositol dimannoside synthase